MPEKKKILYPALFMVLITVIFTSVLATLNYATKDRIDRLEELGKMKSILQSAGYEMEDAKVEQAYAEKIVSLGEIGNQEVFKIVDAGQLKGYTVKFFGPGLWGSITGYVSLSEDTNKVIGVDFLNHSETPGLGGRISEAWFRDQFRDVNLASNGDYIKYKPAQGAQIDAISGATLTSSAVKNILNDSISKFKDNLDKVKEVQ